MLEELPLVVETRGVGLMAGIELVDHTGGDSDNTDMEVSFWLWHPRLCTV